MLNKSCAVILLLFLVSISSPVAADPWEMGLTAGPTSLAAGIHHKSYLDTGYLRLGGSGVYTDDDDTEYKWASLDATVGSDTLFPGMTLDIGLRGILGDADEPGASGNVGAIGFTAAAGYIFSRAVFPIPLEVFGGLTWAPQPLSFLDADRYLEANMGVGLQVIKNASIIASYTYYHLEMESDSADWSLNDDVFRAGLLLRF